MAKGSKTFDASMEVLDIDGVSITATGAQTAANIEDVLLGDMSYVAVVNIISNTGTVDGSNSFTLGLEVSSDATNYYAVGNVISTYDVTAAAAQTGLFEIGFTGNQAVEAAGGSTPTHARITAVKTGTTQTAVSAGCFIAKA